MSADSLIINTPRLALRPLTVPLIEAFLAPDLDRVRELAGGVAPANPIPPLMDDALPYTRDWLVEHGRETTWAWYALDTATRRIVAMGGLGFGPDERGVAFLGYSVYPAFERRRYATELARALVEWGLARDDVGAIEATIPPDHVASIRVAERAGLRLAGTGVDDEVGEVLVSRVE